MTFYSCGIFQSVLQIFYRDSKLCSQIVLFDSDLSNGMLSLLITSFAGEVDAVAIVAGRGGRTCIWFMRPLFGVFADRIAKCFLNT